MAPMVGLDPAKYAGLEGEVVWYDSSGGANTEAKDATVWKDFTDVSGVVTTADFNADSSKFFAAEEAGQVPWSLIEFATYGDFLKAKELGYLEPLDTSVVPVDKLDPAIVDEYGYKAQRYGIVLTYNTDKWPTDGEHPATIEDLYDTEKFPGKRCLFQYPQYGGVLESALVADGVARDALYPLDVDRALAKLDTIKDDIVWWSDGQEAISLLTSGECDLGIAWSGRVFNAVNVDGAPLAISWPNSMYADAVWGIPKGAPNAAAGQAALAAWIEDTAGQIDFVSKIPYPTAITTIPSSDYPSDLAPWLPIGDNAAVAIEEDGVYYSKNIDDVVEKFNAWVSTSS